MKIIDPSVKVLAYTQLVPDKTTPPCLGDVAKIVPYDPCSELSRVVERCGRVSWKSEDKIQTGSADGFCTRVVNIRKDESIAEHCSVTMLFVTDRYASHQLVRHRIGAYTQESTHYINYSKKGKDIEVCRPLGIPKASRAYAIWYDSAVQSERAYFEILDEGVKHYHARFALPGSLKTEIAVTYNLRIWRYVLGLRTTPNNTPEIVAVMHMAGHELSKLCPEMFAEWALTEQQQEALLA